MHTNKHKSNDTPSNEVSKLEENCQLIAMDMTQLNSRLDKNLPVDSQSWIKVEQLLTYLTEFAPTYKIIELAKAVGEFADDQAKRGYVVGQKDLIEELSKKVA